MDEITAYLPGLSPVENKELCVRFDGGRLSSDGGVLVLREIEKRLGLAARLAGCLIEAFDAINDRLGPGAIQFGPRGADRGLAVDRRVPLAQLHNPLGRHPEGQDLSTELR